MVTTADDPEARWTICGWTMEKMEGMEGEQASLEQHWILVGPDNLIVVNVVGVLGGRYVQHSATVVEVAVLALGPYLTFFACPFASPPLPFFQSSNPDLWILIRFPLPLSGLGRGLPQGRG